MTTYTANTAAQAVARAYSRKVWGTDLCLNHVWDCLTRQVKRYGIPHANAGWDRTTLRRYDRTPPAGAPVYWRSARVYGHVALSIGGGRVRSTDWPEPGQLGDCTLAELEKAWGLTYLGYGLDFAGDWIAGIAPVPKPPTTTNPAPTQEEIVSMTPNQVWGADIIDAPRVSTSNPKWTPASYLRHTFLQAERAAASGAKSVAELGALRQVVQELVAKGSGLTLADVEQASYTGAQRALDERIDSATVELVTPAPSVEPTT